MLNLFVKSHSDFRFYAATAVDVVLKTGKINMTFDLIKKELFFGVYGAFGWKGGISSTIIFSMKHIFMVQH